MDRPAGGASRPVTWCAGDALRVYCIGPLRHRPADGGTEFGGHARLIERQRLADRAQAQSGLAEHLDLGGGTRHDAERDMRCWRARDTMGLTSRHAP